MRENDCHINSLRSFLRGYKRVSGGLSFVSNNAQMLFQATRLRDQRLAEMGRVDPDPTSVPRDSAIIELLEDFAPSRDNEVNCGL